MATFKRPIYLHFLVSFSESFKFIYLVIVSNNLRKWFVVIVLYLTVKTQEQQAIKHLLMFKKVLAHVIHPF